VSSSTIDYGIDLGTTNSEIAVLRGTRAEIVPNKDGALLTPSAVFIDKKGQTHVGRIAKDRCEADPDNCAIEFKLRMGQSWKKAFVASGRELLPEEMSAEVLKSLKADVFQMYHEDIQSAVITIPADFDRPAIDATMRAGKFAGFSDVLLLQEPVAAALAYGFQDESKKAFWLVYDFGGGTFDAAVVQVREGSISVVNHCGDNFLGGKLIDWDIVHTKFVPEIIRRFKLADFKRGVVRWAQAFAKLKAAAEEAKIHVSRTWEQQPIWLQDICRDDNGDLVEIDLSLTPDELEEIVTPYVVRSLNLCKKAMREKGLESSDIAKVLMVGGTSCIRALHGRVERELSAVLEQGIDPITVVAQGAAVFAGSQKRRFGGDKAPSLVFHIELDYQPVGNDTAPPVGGTVIAPKSQSLQGYTLEIIEKQSKWRSGRIRLGPDGKFVTEVLAERGRKCEYDLILCDVEGSSVALSPDSFSYTIGTSITGMPLQHSIGVAMANEETDFFLVKGELLPARRSFIHRTVADIKRGDVHSEFTIPLVEGDYKRANRNRKIGEITVHASQLERDLPAGNEVEITIRLDQSGVLTASADIPYLNAHYETVSRLEEVMPNLETLGAEVGQELDRLEKLKLRVQKANDPRAQQTISMIENEEIVQQVLSLVAAAEGGEIDAATPSVRRMLDLRAALDQVEGALVWPDLLDKKTQALSEVKETVGSGGGADEVTSLQKMEAALEEAVRLGDADLLKERIGKLGSLGYQVLARQPQFWVGYLEYLGKRKELMRDQAQANQLFELGKTAIDGRDLGSLENAVRQLIGLLPPDRQEEAIGFRGSTFRPV
jgi:molecular chaperone DnaK